MEDIATLKQTIAALTAENQRLKSDEYRDAILSSDPRYHESLNRFKIIFEASRLGNKIITPDLKIIQVNPAMVALLGFESKEEIIGAKILEFAPVEYHKDWRFLQEKLWQKAMPAFSLETCLRQKNGAIIWCQVTSILFQENGETFGYTIIEDITEAHHLRLQKEEFISIASHELKTPITSLQATVQIISRMVNGDAQAAENLKKLVSNAERHTKKLNHLVGDLLNSTRIEHGQLILNKSIFTLADVIDGCCSHIQLRGDHFIKYTGDHTLTVIADQQKIDQVIVNFVNNAVKYAPGSDEIIIHVERLETSVKVSVSDKGPGIASECMDKLFERYYRVDQYKKQISGLGLGLYISSEIIKRHGGEIGVESEIGKGSTFWFTLPDVVLENYVGDVND